MKTFSATFRPSGTTSKGLLEFIKVLWFTAWYGQSKRFAFGNRGSMANLNSPMQVVRQSIWEQPKRHRYGEHSSPESTVTATENGQSNVVHWLGSMNLRANLAACN